MSKRVFIQHLQNKYLQNIQFSLPFFNNFSSSTDTTVNGLIDSTFTALENDSIQNNPKPPLFSPQEFKILQESLTKMPKNDKYCNFGEGNFIKTESFFVIEGINSINDGFGDKTQKFLRGFRAKLDGNLVIDVLKNVGNAELGVKFFVWAGRQIGYSHSLSVYNALLDLLDCNRDDGKELDRLFQEIMEDDRDVLGKLLNILVQKFCRKGIWNVAVEELGRLKDFGYKPSRGTYNALVYAFLNVEKLESAVLLHKEMVDSGYKLDRHVLNCFTYGLCKEGKWGDALELIEKEEFVPDTVIYTNMIKGLCEASLFEEAMEFLNRMRSCSCIPNNATYDVFLCACLNKRKLGRCKRIISMMMPEGCYPSRKVFNSLVHACCYAGDYSYAYKLLKKMVDCGYQPGYVTYNILIGGICGKEELPSANVLELAEKSYTEMLDKGILLNKINVSNFARCLCAAGKFEEAFDIIRQMMTKGFIPDASTYSKVIEFLCNSSKVDKAFQLFQQMKRNGVSPDVYTYTILIDSFSKAGLIGQARIWLDEMVRDGCAPNVVTYTTLIHAYLKANNITAGNELFEAMLSEGCIPNIITFTALIDGFCKAGCVDKAFQIYRRLKGTHKVSDIDMYFQLVPDASVEPNVVTYGALVDGLCKLHRVKEARDLLDVMSSEGCMANQIVYDALIDGFCKVGKLDEAQEVFSKMSELGYNPSVYTYSSLIDRLFKDKRLDLALKVLSSMLENSCPPNVVIYSVMVDGLCKIGKTDEAYKLTLMMEEKGCHPNVVTYTSMIDGFARAGKLDRSLELFEYMGSKGSPPNYITYTALIHHLCAAGRLDEAYQLLEEMKQTYWPMSKSNYHKVLEGFNREFIISLGLLDEISLKDSAPIVPVYRLLIDTFCKAGKLDMALKLHKEISSSSAFTSRDEKIYSSLIESCSYHNVNKAFELYSEMTKRALVPELSTFVHLVKGLIAIGRWEEALELCESLCYMDICWIGYT
ncbi:hypothetical protein Leryth_011728 [Lithospermum erythrorhizon]|nr:hypothetical protein Leryth_011728 [Lithospermum erythrorhizon]